MLSNKKSHYSFVWPLKFLALLQLVPLCDLPSWRSDHLVPVLLRRRTARRPSADVHLANQLIPRHPIVVKHLKLQRNVLQALLRRNVKNEAFIEDRAECALLHVRSLLEEADAVVEDVQLYVRV